MKTNWEVKEEADNFDQGLANHGPLNISTLPLFLQMFSGDPVTPIHFSTSRACFQCYHGRDDWLRENIAPEPKTLLSDL